MNLLCRILGHRTEYIETSLEAHCRRCDEFDYYPPGEPALVSDMVIWCRWQRLRLRSVLRRSFGLCPDCGKPNISWGRKIGEHGGCDEIPF